MSQGAPEVQYPKQTWLLLRTQKFSRAALGPGLAKALEEGQGGCAPHAEMLTLCVQAAMFGPPFRSGSCFSSFLPFQRQPFQLWF